MLFSFVIVAVVVVHFEIDIEFACLPCTSLMSVDETESEFVGKHNLR